MIALRWTDLFADGLPPGDHVTELAPRRDVSPEPPAFTFGPTTAELNRFYYNEFIIHPVRAVTLANAGVAGDGFPVRDATFLTAPAFGLSPSYISSRLNNTNPVLVRRQTGRGVCLSAPGYLIYGHWLVDILPKLYLLAELGIDLANETLVLPADTPKFGIAWLELLGITPKRGLTYDPASEVIVFDELLLPLQLRANSRVSDLFQPAIRFLADRLARTVTIASPVASTRIYVSRGKTAQVVRRLVNAEALEDVARANGFTVVHPELLSLPQQVALFRTARYLVGEYGSALHASLFAGPECVVCALRGTGTDPGFLQSALCTALGQRIGYVFGETHVGEDGQQSFHVDPADMQAAIHTMNLLGG